MNTLEKELVTLSEVSKILGLDYFHARKVLLDSSIDYYQYGRKRLWNLTDILNFKEQHHVRPMEDE